MYQGHFYRQCYNSHRFTLFVPYLIISVELKPVILAELIFVAEAPTSEVVAIVSTVENLIKKQLLSAKPQIE